MTSRRFLSFACTVALLGSLASGCPASSEPGGTDAGMDSGTPTDARADDAPPAADAPVADDVPVRADGGAGDVDAGDVDAGDVDAGDVDAGDVDAGTVDVDAGGAVVDGGFDAGFDAGLDGGFDAGLGFDASVDGGSCGAAGQACDPGNGRDCPSGYLCEGQTSTQPGVCVPDHMATCGILACPASLDCLLPAGSTGGPCVTTAERDCVCGSARGAMIYSGTCSLVP